MTYRLLTRPAFSAVRDTECGITAHTHSAECFTTCDTPGCLTLVCDPCHDGDNVISHIHDAFCYDPDNELICPIMEYEHCHSAECCNEDMEILCGVTYHQHSKDCLHIIAEGEAFDVLCCELPSHDHNASCYPAPAVAAEMPDEAEDEIVPGNDAAVIMDDAYDYDDTPEPFAMFLAEGDANVVIDDTNSVILDKDHIASSSFQYGQKVGNDTKWISVVDSTVEIPANSPVKIEIKYKDINIADLLAKNKRLVYQGIPLWLKPDEKGVVTDGEQEVADIEVIGDKAVITFKEEYLQQLQAKNDTEVDGSFSLEGNLDWREINALGGSAELPLIDFTFKFEDDLASKYGDFEVTKTAEKKVIEVTDDDGGKHSYLKYELKIRSKETRFAVEKITITDTLSTNNNTPAIDRVIKSPGYVKVTSQEKALGDSENGLNPYETITNSSNSDHGKIKLDENNHLTWTIDKLEAGEERTLVYYVELNDDYVGSSSAGALLNEAEPKSGEFPREKAIAEFIPKADVSVKKSSDGVKLDSAGTGKLSYKIEVTADPENSYTITDAWIQDLFQWHMDEYADRGADVEVTIKSNMSADRTTTVRIWDSGEGFDLPIGDLKAGEKLKITYSVPVTHVYAAGNKDFNFQNRVSFFGGRSESKLEKNHYFGDAFAQTYIYHNSWTRKMNGTTVMTAKTVNFGAGDKVYNSDKTLSTDTSFVVPEKAQEYIVIVNEDGTWNMSGAAFNDSFNDARISYTGYLKIEEFDQVYTTGTNTNTITNTQLSSDLNAKTPNQTVWVNIDGQKSFSVTPKDFGLENKEHVYRLTYYAAINSESSNIKNIVVSNTFNLTGEIGIGKDLFQLNGIGTTVQSTIIGSASYNIEKSGLFYNDGKVYWVIRAEGMLPENMHLQDRIPQNSNNSFDSLLGIYLGDKDAVLSGFSTYNDLKNTLDTTMTPYNIGTRGYTYSLVGINSPADLDGNDYAIFTPGEHAQGYMTVDESALNKLTCEYLDSALSCPSECSVNEKAQMWHFRLVDNEKDKFYVYFTDSSGNTKYLNINSQNGATVSSTEMVLTVGINNDNKICIKNAGGMALNFFGGGWNAKGVKDYYSAWDYSAKDPNNWHYIATETASSSGDFSKDSNGNIYVNHQVDIPKGKAVYMIVSTQSTVTPSDTYSTSYKNEVGVVDNATGIYNKLNETEYIYKPKKAVKKEAMVAAYYDASKAEWSLPYSVNPSGDRDTVDKIKKHFDTGGQVSRNGSGLYMEWLINVNWDGTLSGDYILTDYLDKDKYEPVVVRNFWAKHPGYKKISELDADDKWEYRDDTAHGNIPYYYNKETGEIKISVSGLAATGKLNKGDTVANVQLICRVIDPDIIFTGQNATIPNSFSLDKTDGEHINDGIVYHQIRPAYSIDKKAVGVGDTNNDNNVQHHTNRLNYEININPNKEDFINGDVLPDLIDEMSNSMELVGKIEVYEKDGDTEKLLDTISYTTIKGDTTTKITISGLPDNKHLVIKYSTRVNTAPGVTAAIYNSAYWKGYSKPVKPQHTESYSFTITGTVSGHGNPTIVINKVDLYNTNLFLSGAVFEIRKVDTDGKIEENPPKTYTTVASGTIEINDLEYNTVYQLKETRAPTYYVLDSTPRYFMVIKNNEHGYTFTDGKMTIAGKEEQVLVDCAVSSGTDMTLNISNAKGKIKVNKVFRNENGEEIYQPDNGSFKFGLYYADPAGQSAVKPVQILNIVYKNHARTYLLDGEEVNSPEFTKARVGNSNYVYELDGNDQPITVNNERAYLNERYYEICYDNAGNHVLIPGQNVIEVTITNKEYNIYLPVTGGKGVFWYYKNALRVLMICLASAVIVIFLKKRRSGHCN